MSTILALTTVLALATSPSKTAASSPAVVDSSKMTLVVVQNDEGTPLTIYVEGAEGDFKLGVVGPFDTEALQLPDAFVRDGASFDFFVHPKHGLEQESGYVELHRGEKIGLVVPRK